MAELIYWHNPKTGAVWSDVDVRFHCKDTTGWTRIVLPPPAGAQQAVASKMEVDSWRRALLVWRDAGVSELVEDRAGLKQCLSNAARLLLEHPALAAPAAAQGAVNAIAALVPQIEDSIHGKRYRCQQCGYAWGAGLDGSEAHATNCAYVIATSVPHTPSALVAATPAPEAAPSAKEGEAPTDAELGAIAYKGFDDYWTENSAGNDDEAWQARARAVRNALKGMTPAGGDR
ncbi:hypothetical protein ABL840_08960 [Variovorax sp. NFACC27]|uniref:hypothetical protein n=1 Tax=unclassified Variovorax TaxID=663243 RepID=UPI0008995254|nr:hypothetical protein SAMN03159371_05300 [Variovorax sp. NFACC28]SEG89553.1 hypothetical protein SAMN03159365_05147 [Variovorax sp. NFACC29]SFD40895.1 hypothetical protein SAMN03159379_05190 [Variovorax sp. NFACC26]SFG43023.1 hypothetical protein SAMN03159447_03300 [Variovorax sp. NFACC27]